MSEPINCSICGTFVGSQRGFRGDKVRCRECYKRRMLTYHRDYHRKRKLEKWKKLGIVECPSTLPSGVKCQRPKRHVGMHRAVIMWTSEEEM